jgi:mannitol-1-phosphate/altronate dehydrogenase
MAYLIRGARRFGAPWVPDDPIAAEVAAIAEASGDDPPALVAGIVGIRTIFAPELAQNDQFRAVVASALAGLLSPDPRGFVADRCRSEAALP